MKYPKIQTIWKRDENNKYVIMEGEYSKEEFVAVKFWDITEKIDGTNIRMFFTPDDDLAMGGVVRFGGRTEKSQIPTFLIDYLLKTFTYEKLDKHFDSDVILYGEGYGGKMQKVGKLYREDISFILFDVWIDGWWLDQDKVHDIAEKLGIESVPSFGIMTTEQAIEFVKSRPKSAIAQKDMVMEGIVARSEPLMLFRNGNPLMWKLKVEDYEKLERFET